MFIWIGLIFGTISWIVLINLELNAKLSSTSFLFSATTGKMEPDLGFRSEDKVPREGNGRVHHW